MRIVKDEYTFVTNNRLDFVRLFSRVDLHAGLIVLIPNVIPKLQGILFEAALQYLAGRDLVNAVIEVTLDRNVVSCIEYALPPE